VINNNITELCNQVRDISSICSDLCAKTLKVCLDEAIEPSYNNPFAACQEFTQNCNYICNNVTTICLPTDYPINHKYSNNQNVIITILIIEGLLAIVGLCLLIMEYNHRFEKNEEHLSLFLGQITGLALGAYFTLLIRNALFLPPMKRFTQNNPADYDVTNMIIAASAMPTIAASIGVCGLTLDLGIPLIKKPMLSAYKSFKDRSRRGVQNMFQPMTQMIELELEENTDTQNSVSSASNPNY